MILLWDWRDLGTPPSAGGLLNQPAGLLRRAKYLEAVFNIMQLWYSGHGTQITKHDKVIFDYVLILKRERDANSR